MSTVEDERAEWHRRIEEAPLDLELRQVFADWLLGQGDPRGELIQLECRSVREPEHPEKRAWQRRASTLRKEHGESFFGPNGAKLETRAGMIEEAPLAFYRDGRSLAKLDELHAYAPALMRADMTISYVEEPELTQIVEHPVWRRLRALEVTSTAAHVMRRILEHTALPRLEGLRLRGLPAAESALLRLLVDGDHGPSRTPHLSRLEIPSPSGASSDGLTAESLAVVARMKSLTSLDLYGNSLTIDSARALAAGSALRGITELRLGSTQLGSEGVSALAACAHISTLRHVDLRRIRLGNGDAEALTAFASATPALRALELMGNPLTPAALAAIARHDLWRELEELSLQGCSLDDEGLALVLRHPRRLRALNVKSNKLTDAAVDVIAKADTAPSLVVLNLEGNPIAPAAVKRLAASERLADAVISAAPKASSMFSAPTNDKHGLWLGSTTYRGRDVVTSPGLRAAPKKKRSRWTSDRDA